MPEIGQETIDNLNNMCRKHHIHLSTRWHTRAEDWWQATPREGGHPFCGTIVAVQGYVAGYADAREHIEATIAGHRTKIQRELDGMIEEIFRYGYVVGAADLPAAGAGAPHRRNRIFFVAHEVGRDHASHGLGDAGGTRGRRDPRALPGEEARGARGRIDAGHLTDVTVPAGATRGFWHPADWILCRDPAGGPPVARPVEPGTFPLVAGLPGRMGLLRGYGNSIVPQVAAAFVRAALWAIATTGEVS